MEVLKRYGETRQEEFTEDRRRGDRLFFRLEGDEAIRLSPDEAESQWSQDPGLLFSSSCLDFTFEYPLCNVDFEKCPWPAMLRMKFRGRLAPTPGFGRWLRNEMGRDARRDAWYAPEFFYGVMEMAEQELRSWFRLNLSAMDPAMIQDHGPKAVLADGEKMPAAGLPDWLDAELTGIEFTASPAEKEATPEAERNARLACLAMRHGLPDGMLQEFASRHGLEEAEKWIRLAHSLAHSLKLDFPEAFERLSALPSLEKAAGMTETEATAARNRRAARRLQAKYPCAALESLDNLVRELDYRGEKAVHAHYERLHGVWGEANALHDKLGERAPSVESLYKEMAATSVKEVRDRLRPPRRLRRLLAWTLAGLALAVLALAGIVLAAAALIR